MELEVSKKVRAAIKAKLEEMGVHVDEELPDYVMVLVANRRSRVQMEQDLNLFLGDNTNRFVIWLHHVLKKLEEVTANLPAPEGKKRKASVEDTSSTKKSKSAEEKGPKVGSSTDKKVDKKKPAETSKLEEPEKSDKDVGKEEINDQLTKPKDRHSKKDKPKKEVAKQKQSPKKEELPKEEKVTKPNFKFQLKRNKIIGKSSLAEEEEGKIKLTLLDADNEEEFISLNVNSNEFEFDELENLRQVALESQKTKAENKPRDTTEKVETFKTTEKAATDTTVEQVVTTTKSPEKPVVSEVVHKSEIQCPPKKADKCHRLSSSSKGDRLYYKPPSRNRSPEKSDRHRSRSPRKDRNSKDDRRRHRSPRRSDEKRLKSVINVGVEPPPKKIKSQVIKKEEEYDPLKPVISTRKLAVNNLILKAVAEAQKSVTAFAILETGKRSVKKPNIKDRLGAFVDGGVNESYCEEDLKKIVIKVPTSPKPKERISIRVNSTEESTSDEEYDIIEEIIEEDDSKEDEDGDIKDLHDPKDSVKDKQPKEVKEQGTKGKPTISIECSPKVILKERPLQTVSPTIKLPSVTAKEPPQCKYWPTCTFKEKCLYPHPKCKFGSKCTKVGCAYKHDKDVCKFFPNCHSLSCSFYHPSPCRFGNGCKDSNCQLYHPGRSSSASPTFQNSGFSNFNAPVLPAKHLLKWTKN